MERRFIELIKEQLPDKEVETFTAERNNGTKATGVRISIKGADIPSPIIYYNPEWDDEHIANYVVTAYDASKCSDFDSKSILNRDSILDRVYPILVNREANRGLLMDAVHEPFLNLEIMYRIDFAMGDGNGSILMKIPLIEHFKISPQELYDAAMKNIQNKGTIESLLEVIGMPVEGGYEKDPASVISSNDKYYGAGAIFDQALIERLVKKYGQNFYLIPSSVHEFIAIPTSLAANVTLDEVLELINSSNHTVIDPMDFLSDSLYKFENGDIREVKR